MEDLLEIYKYKYKYKNSPNIKIIKISILEQTDTFIDIGVQVVLDNGYIDYTTINKKDYNVFLRGYKINKILNR